ncbi:hypothetical protein H2248_007214 [Termitomyces sp. 'cryptogamus']|nr:hypothetical protein H2248_007214 [Termitomyces sp. 'cryptogamus']
MSTSSLPSLVAPLFTRTLSRSAEPHQSEHRIAWVDRLRSQPTDLKKSRNSDAQLRLVTQDNSITFPTYGEQGCVEGVLKLFKVDSVVSVDVKIEGRLLLKEIAEGGTTSAKLCLATDVLWQKDSTSTPCPKSLPFSLYLPSTLTLENKTYPLPPTFDVKLSGLPGFHATIDYTVIATITKPQPIPTPSRLPVKSTVLSGFTTVSTPFKYYPRSRPETPLPSPLVLSHSGLVDARDWTCHQSEIRSKDKGLESIRTKFYLPTSCTFCISQPIPFYVTFESSSDSLTSFLPLSTAGSIKRDQSTHVQLMRQSTVDVRNAVIAGTKTDIWRIDCIGEGSFRHVADGPTWTAFSGNITIDETVHVTGFRVAGLSVKDCIIFSISPPDRRSPFAELRQTVPVKLTTDPWVADSTDIQIMHHTDLSEYSLSSTSVLNTTIAMVHD